MKNHKQQLEKIANSFLEETDKKPNYSNRDFLNSLIIFQRALMDKMFDNQNSDNMELVDRQKMATKCGLDLRKLIHTYTGLDTHKIEEFI